MSGRARRGFRVLVAVAVVVMMSACARGGDLSISNLGPDAVVVLTGDDEVSIAPDGGVVLLGYGCTPGDVTVRFTSGAVTVVPGPVCAEERIVIHDGEARVKPATRDDV